MHKITRAKLHGKHDGAADESVARGWHRGFLAVLLSLAGGAGAPPTRDAVVDILLRVGSGLLNADETFVLLHDDRGELGLVGASSVNAQSVGRAELAYGGPGRRADTTHAPADLTAGSEQWSESFTAATARLGLQASYAVPLRAGGQTLGAYVLCWRSAGGPEGLRMYAETIGRMAAVGLVNQSQVAERDRRTDQLQQALTSRVLIEQAKGILAERGGINLEKAFVLLRQRARTTQRSLVSVAAAVVGASHGAQQEHPPLDRGRVDHMTPRAPADVGVARGAPPQRRSNWRNSSVTATMPTARSATT